MRSLPEHRCHTLEPPNEHETLTPPIVVADDDSTVGGGGVGKDDAVASAAEEHEQALPTDLMYVRLGSLYDIFPQCVPPQIY